MSNNANLQILQAWADVFDEVANESEHLMLSGDLEDLRAFTHRLKAILRSPGIDPELPPAA